MTRKDKIEELLKLFEYVQPEDDKNQDGFYQLKEAYNVDVESWQFKALFGENRSSREMDYVYDVIQFLDDCSDDQLNGDDLYDLIDTQGPLSTYVYHQIKWFNTVEKSVDWADAALADDEGLGSKFESYYDLMLRAQYLYFCDVLSDVLSAIDDLEA
jgi:hypothetical protein